MASPRSLAPSSLAILLALACAGCRQGPCASVEPPASPPEMALLGAVLLDGLGDYSFPVTSRHAGGQRWFDQGLALTYGSTTTPPNAPSSRPPSSIRSARCAGGARRLCWGRT